MKQILVVDFGGQYTHLIVRRIRSLGLFAALVKPEELSLPLPAGTVGVVLSGGPASVSDGPTLPCSPYLLPVPVLGLCYGHQLLAHQCGGEVATGRRGEFGLATVDCLPDSLLFAGTPLRQRVWMSHQDHVVRLPDGWRVTASSEELPVAACESADGRLFGLQFHPEVSHTQYGMAILDSFLRRCSADRPWQPANLPQSLIERVRREAGERPLFLLVSGGVDSLVALALTLAAVGPERVHSLHVDTGLMRENESAEVMSHLGRLGFANLHIVEAGPLFLSALAGVVEPEAKRRIIGRLFVEVLSEELARLRLGDDWMLVQGTIYPDTIESGGSDRAATIKTHHNRVAEIEALIAQGRVLEPLDQLYKDEVRELGRALGLPTGLLDRHPFPGPGLGIRVLCSDGCEPSLPPAAQEKASSLAATFGLEARILPVRSVGVQGDSRTYRHPLALWSPDGGPPDWEVVQQCATTACNRLPDVNRAVLSPEPLCGRSFSLVATDVNRTSVARLQRVDSVVRAMLQPIPEVWQVPVVSLPLVDDHGRQLTVMRPVTSTDAMTADFFRIPWPLFRELAARVAGLEGSPRLLLDVTAKPPATIEWE